MELIAWVGFGLAVILCGLFLLTCWGGARSTPTRNAWAGIRIPSTMVSDEAWTAAHAAALPHANICAIAVVPVVVVMLFFIGTIPLVAAVMEWALATVALAWMLVATAVASRAAKAVTNADH
ncbi:MAG: SdpI family protein [Propionibacteriaceae bacterium]|jgi:hypothetical protein|nr:SdpI family protein [Propionibacteriaceae bacterium]